RGWGEKRFGRQGRTDTFLLLGGRRSLLFLLCFFRCTGLHFGLLRSHDILVGFLQRLHCLGGPFHLGLLKQFLHSGDQLAFRCHAVLGLCPVTGLSDQI